MNKTWAVLAILFLAVSFPAQGQDLKRNGDEGGGGIKSGGGKGHYQKSPKKARPAKPRGNFQNRKTGGAHFQAAPASGGHHFNNSPRGNQNTSGAMKSAPALHHFNNASRPVPSGKNPSMNAGAGFKHSQNSAAGRINPSLQRMGVKKLPPAFKDQHQILQADRAHSKIAYPTSGPQGRPLHATLIEPRAMNNLVVRNHMSLVNTNIAFRAQITNFNNVELVRNNYYWHSYNGFNYCHYYDPWGYHWYGWYVGGSYFWTRHWNNYWWWYDPVSFRWCYWWGGNWWWNDPSRAEVVCVYNNGSYVPSTSTNTEMPGGTASMEYRSQDGSRMVKVVGNDAFLYDTADVGVDNKPAFLGSNVTKVKFSNTSNGKPLQVMLEYNDGTFALFDSDGNPTGGNPGN